METGDTRVIDPVDAVHHEMDSAIYSHCAYKSVHLPVKRKQII